ERPNHIVMGARGGHSVVTAAVTLKSASGSQHNGPLEKARNASIHLSGLSPATLPIQRARAPAESRRRTDGRGDAGARQTRRRGDGLVIKSLRHVIPPNENDRKIGEKTYDETHEARGCLHTCRHLNEPQPDGLWRDATCRPWSLGTSKGR